MEISYAVTSNNNQGLLLNGNGIKRVSFNSEKLRGLKCVPFLDGVWRFPLNLGSYTPMWRYSDNNATYMYMT